SFSSSSPATTRLCPLSLHDALPISIAIAFVYLTTSAIAFLTLGLDKRRARRGEWRVPESTLHALELLGGWPGSFFGQRVHRHKTDRKSTRLNSSHVKISYAVFCLKK